MNVGIIFLASAILASIAFSLFMVQARLGDIARELRASRTAREKVWEQK